MFDRDRKFDARVGLAYCEHDKDTGTIVFVIGAGCSVDCQAPTMDQFFLTARQYARQYTAPSDPMFWRSYQEFFRFYFLCRDSEQVMDRSWENIEELYTQAHLREMVEHDAGICCCLENVRMRALPFQ